MFVCCLRCNTVGEDVATDRCRAADAGSPAGSRGGPAGQSDRVAPGARSGPGGAGAPCPVIGRWCPAPRGTGEVTWGRRAMSLGRSGGVWCGAEVHFVRCGEGHNIFRDEVKWCEVSERKVT